MIPRRVRMAVLIAFLGHGLFILAARYRLSYDAYTHMLFANHYAENWFSLWETRWYTGFTVVSYPPLTHQLIASFIPLLGFDRAFALILWVVASLYPLGIYAFSRIFTGRSSAAYAALASAILLPIYVVAHIFGQLPFLASTLLALFAAASLDRYLREGGVHNFLLTVSLYTTAMALHHAVLMVHPFLVQAVIIKNLFNHRDTKTLGFNKTNSAVAVPPRLIFRFLLVCAFSVLFSLLVIFPFWGWGMDQTLQTPIDHLSRHNFLTDPLALAIFFLPLYGPLAAVIPFLVRKWQPRFIGLLAAFAILFLLGLGGTTPLPRLLFGSAWEWLTYDRFAFWACLTLTPFFGILFIRMKKRLRLGTKPKVVPLRRDLVPALTFSVFIVTTLGAWFTPIVFPLQPKPIEMKPIVEFLDKGDHSQWRYVTFGFGDQFAFLNLLTRATTIDGSYHTARTLPELRQSGLGQIDTSYWALNGMNAIIPILQRSGERGVRWGFVNTDTVQAAGLRWGTIHRSPFVPILNELGWRKVETLSNGVMVYENPNALLPNRVTPPDAPPFTSFAWGVFPMLAFVSAAALGALRVVPVQAEWIIRKIHAFVVGLLPIALCFWIYRIAGEFSHPRVYFTYDNALFFLSDALVLLAVVLWVAVQIAKPHKFPLANYPLPVILFFVFCLLATLSTFWSRDWRTTLYISLHFWLVFLFFLSLRDWHKTWRIAMFGLCAGLTIQLVAGFAGFGLQSTGFLDPLTMKWPGTLEPSVRGASVVQLENGFRLLRAYGTLPHPNILGGFVLLALLGPASLFLARQKPTYQTLLLLSL
ncbi:MAG: hypothetical protein FIB03_12070, partial [Anaerolineae bacterium]|nr:hypothetical protein [Anaerolineae bacterium]